MHAQIKNIFDAHQKWMKEGGDQSIKVVQDANLIQNIDIALKAVIEAEYKRGFKDGYKAAQKGEGPAESGPGADGGLPGVSSGPAGPGHHIEPVDGAIVPTDK